MNIKRLFALSLFAAFGCVGVSANAQDWAGLNYFGNYRPYGVQTRSLSATPPYFALHPPVYYGSRHARPYGVSPFAAYPQVAVPPTYKARIQSSFVKPPQTNPYCPQATCSNENQASEGHTVAKRRRKNGPMRSNPYVVESDVSLASSDI